MLQFIFLVVVCVFNFNQRTEFVNADSVPLPVKMAGAVVAAVEEDVEQEAEAEEELQLSRQLLEGEELLWQHLNNDTLNWNAIKSLFSRLHAAGDAVEGRGKYRKKQRKILKYLYPLLMGLVLAKSVVIPLVLKMLTALSTSSFVMSKIALAASGLLLLRWLLPTKEHTHLEIVQIPPTIASKSTTVWSDSDWSGTNYIDNKSSYNTHHKYIPLIGSNGGVASVKKQKGFDATLASSIISNGYRYPHNTYEYTVDGKPFL